MCRDLIQNCEPGETGPGAVDADEHGWGDQEDWISRDEWLGFQARSGANHPDSDDGIDTGDEEEDVAAEEIPDRGMKRDVAEIVSVLRRFDQVERSKRRMAQRAAAALLPVGSAARQIALVERNRKAEDNEVLPVVRLPSSSQADATAASAGQPRGCDVVVHH